MSDNPKSCYGCPIHCACKMFAGVENSMNTNNITITNMKNPMSYQQVYVALYNTCTLRELIIARAKKGYAE